MSDDVAVLTLEHSIDVYSDGDGADLNGVREGALRRGGARRLEPDAAVAPDPFRPDRIGDRGAATLAAARAVATGPHEGAAVEQARRNPAAAAKIDEILAFIAARAAHADLTPDKIARHTGVSRSVLYRMLKPCGGVAAVVQEQRLNLMRDALCDRADSRSVKAIVHGSGLRSLSHATRLFHRTFGTPPASFRRASPNVPKGPLRDSPGR